MEAFVPNEIKIFEHEKFGELRIADQDGEPWFIAKDVATALGYEDTKKAIAKYCKKAKILMISRGAGVTPPRIIPESDVYRLVMRSALPMAVELQDWVCEEVLPSIRKTGSYTLPGAELPTEALPAWEAAYAFAKKHGYHGNQAILTASKVIKKAHGVDIPALMGETELCYFFDNAVTLLL